MARGRGGRSSFSGVTATVFGATGFLGKFVVNRFGAVGTQLVLPYRTEPWLFKELRTAGALGQLLFTEFHLNDEESIARAVQHSDVVVNMIGRDHETRNFTFRQANAEGAGRIARISKKMGVKKFVHVSAMNCDKTYEGYCVLGGSKYLKTKFEGEQLVREEFPEAIIIRPADMYGHADKSDRFLWYLLNWNRMSQANFPEEPYRVPMGGRGIYKQPIYAGDVAQAIVNASLRSVALPGMTYQAVGPRRYEYRDIIDWILRATRRRGAYDMPNTEIRDLKYFPILLVQAYINELLQDFQFKPKGNMILDKIERETVSDVVDPALPLIDDLGVENLELLEHKGRSCVEIDQKHAILTPYPGEWPEVYPAKFTTPDRPSFM